ncbi:MAG: ribose 5-phosphate isomerase B [Patescibacteria group bacterium]
MRVFIGSDHGGYDLKGKLYKYLSHQGFKVQDLGNSVFDLNDDYPDWAEAVTKKVVSSKDRGILICRNGIGMSIAANKIKGIRAVITTEVDHARSSRLDDDTNILCLGQDYTNYPLAKRIVDVWLRTKFSNLARHNRRLKKLKKLESRNK